MNTSQVSAPPPFLAVLAAFMFTSLATSGPAAVAAGELATPPPLLGRKGQAGYQDFLGSAFHRAFAVAPGGVWAWVSDIPDPQAAESEAIRTCRDYTDQRCTIYAVDDQVVLDQAAWAASWGPYLDAAEAATRPVGTRRAMRFPNLRLADPDGVPTMLSDRRGRIVVLHFWGSWCAPCQIEFPELQRLYQSLESDGRIAFVAVQAREDIGRSRRWARRHDITVPLFDSGLLGAADHAFRLADGSDVEDRVLAPRFPATYVLDGNGVILFAHLGPVERWPEYALFLRHAADHMPPPAAPTALSPPSATD